MERRGFLRLLGSAVAAGVALTALPADGFDSLVWSRFPTAGPLSVVDFETMTRRVALAFERELGLRAVYEADLPGDGAHLGDHVLVSGEPVMVTALIGHEGDPLGFAPGVDVDARMLDVYGCGLARHAHAQDMNMFAPMLLPKGVAEAVNVRLESGIWMRAVMFYSIQTDQMLTRFDVLGGRV